MCEQSVGRLVEEIEILEGEEEPQVTDKAQNKVFLPFGFVVGLPHLDAVVVIDKRGGYYEQDILRFPAPVEVVAGGEKPYPPEPTRQDKVEGDYRGEENQKQD